MVAIHTYKISTATLALAITFTLSCSSGDKGSDDPNNNGLGDNCTVVYPQVYITRKYKEDGEYYKDTVETAQGYKCDESRNILVKVASGRILYIGHSEKARCKDASYLLSIEPYRSMPNTTGTLVEIPYREEMCNQQ